MINRLVALVALVVVTTACSAAKIPNPVAPSATMGKLTVVLTAEGGAPLAGIVSIFKGDSNVGTKFVEAGASAVFPDLSAGSYRVTAVSEFYQLKETSFAIENREEQLRFELAPVPYEIRLVEVLADGQALKPGNIVSVPTTLSFKVKVMNGLGTPLAVQVRMYGDPDIQEVGMGTSSAIEAGLQELAVTIPNFRGCTRTGSCFDRSKLVFLHIGNHPFQGALTHRIVEVPLQFAR